MKKYFLFFAPLILTLLFSSCNVTFDGYYYHIDEARADEKIYLQYDYMFTTEREDKIVDFVINDGKLQISKIVCRNSGGKTQYKAKAISAFIMDEHIASFNSNNGYHWSKTSNIPYQVEFCIVTKAFKDSHNEFECFEFEYDGIDYCLCYKFSEN